MREVEEEEIGEGWLRATMPMMIYPSVVLEQSKQCQTINNKVEQRHFVKESCK